MGAGGGWKPLSQTCHGTSQDLRPTSPPASAAQRRALPRHHPAGEGCVPPSPFPHRLPREVCSSAETPQAKRLRASSSPAAGARGCPSGRAGSRSRWKAQSREACTARCCVGKRMGSRDTPCRSTLRGRPARPAVPSPPGTPGADPPAILVWQDPRPATCGGPSPLPSPRLSGRSLQSPLTCRPKQQLSTQEHIFGGERAARAGLPAPVARRRPPFMPLPPPAAATHLVGQGPTPPPRTPRSPYGAELPPPAGAAPGLAINPSW